jgi:spermidine/putrescine transport system ATP-binding protein
VEAHGSAGANRVTALVERVVYLGAATQVMLRLATGESLQAVVPNDAESAGWSQGTPVHAYLPPDCLRVLPGGASAGSSPAAGEVVETPLAS